MSCIPSLSRFSSEGLRLDRLMLHIHLSIFAQTDWCYISTYPSSLRQTDATYPPIHLRSDRLMLHIHLSIFAQTDWCYTSIHPSSLRQTDAAHPPSHLHSDRLMLHIHLAILAQQTDAAHPPSHLHICPLKSAGASMTSCWFFYCFYLEHISHLFLVFLQLTLKNWKGSWVVSICSEQWS